MTDDDEAFERFLMQPSEGYAQLYPSILPRLRTAYRAGNANVRRAVLAMAMALSNAKDHRERRLRDAFGLTPMEVRVVLHLTDGAGTVSSCAEALSVAESTIRSHLKSIFAKTGVRRQAHLAKLL